MGLLDFNFEDPRNLGLLRAGAGMMAQAGDTSKPFGMGQAIAYGMDTYANTLEADKKRKLEEQLAQQKIFETQENNLYTRNLRQAQQEELQQKTAGMLAKQNTIKEMQAKFAKDPNYTPTAFERLALGETGVFMQKNRYFEPMLVKNNEGKYVYVQPSTGGETKEFAYNPVGNLKYVRGGPETPDMRVNLLTNEAEPVRLNESPTFKATGNAPPLPTLPSFGQPATQPTVSGKSAFNIPLPSGLPPELQSTQTMPEQPQGKPSGIFRTKPEKKMSEKDELTYRTQIANDYGALESVKSGTVSIRKAVDELLKNEKGVQGITGLQADIYSFPNSAAAKAEVALQAVKGKITKLGKDAASQSGALGAIAKDEWRIMSDMIAAVDPRKGKDAFVKQINNVVEYAEDLEKRMNDVYKKQYEQDFQKYPQFSPNKSSNATSTNTGKVMTMADVNATAISRGIPVQQVIDKARAAGYQIGGQ